MTASRSISWPLLALLGAGATAAGCSLLVSTGDLSGGSAVDVSSDARPPELTDAGDASDGNAAVAADADVSDAQSSCPNAGAAMVRVGSFCIDSTEVTNAQYLAFLAGKAGDTSNQTSVCAWNTSYTPAVWPVSGGDALPVVEVDWCDAYAYCSWAGKRLCGRIGGGSLAIADGSKASVSQWYSACSHNADSLHAYPYGATYGATTCNTGEHDAGGPLSVGSLPACQGGYAGVFDMSGNVWEWEDACDTTDGGPENEACSLRGGGFDLFNSNRASCASIDVSYERFRHFANLGFRCCAP